MEGVLIIVDADTMLKAYKNKIVFPGGEIYLNNSDSLDFVSKCEEYKISIFRIEILKITKSETMASLDKIFDCDDQVDVYEGARNFINSQMDYEWNYATFVTN